MKNLKILFMLCIIMCVAIAASACVKTHNFSTDWTNDETNHWHSCSDEGCEEVSDKETHTFGEGKVTTPATEAAEGVMTYACTVCGYEKTESISKLAHAHNLSKVAKVEASCTANGAEAYYTCSGCDLIFSDAEGKNEIDAPKAIPAKNHNWEDATCEAPKTCINCDATEGEKLEHTPAAAVEENKVEATCGTAGSYDSVVKCGECGFEISRETKEIPATGNHVYVYEIERVPAKCEIDGYVVKKCTCGATEKTTLKAPGYHTYDNDDDMICNIEGCGYDRSCKHVNVKVLEAVAATCTSTGLTEGKQCEDCDAILVPQEVTEKTEHTSGNPIEENRNEASCLVDGSYEKVVKCSECGYEISRETVVIKAPGQHTYDDDQDMICNNCPFDRSCKHTNTEVIPAVDATCTSTGLTEGAKCKDCGYITVPQTETEMATHTAGEPVEENRNEATCEADGSYDSVVYCSVCQTYEISRTPNTIPAIDHAYDDEFDAECNNGCGTVRDVPHAITVTGGSSDKEYAMVGDTVTLTADAAGENKAFSHWTLNGAKIEGNTFAMPDGEATVVAVFVDTLRKIATPNNSASQKIYMESSGTIALDRGGTMFGTGVEYVLFYVYISADANKEDYIAQFKLNRYDGSPSISIVTSFETMDGVVYQSVQGGKGSFWIANECFYTVLKDILGYSYSDGKTYYFAVQSIAYTEAIDENGIAITYQNSEISEIGSDGFARDASVGTEEYTISVSNGTIDGEHTTVNAGYGVVINITANAKEDDEFAYWVYVTYDENGAEVLGEHYSDDESITLTVASSLSIKAMYQSEVVERIKLDAPDNSSNQMINFNYPSSGKIQYDQQKNEDGSAKTAFTEGVAYIRYWIFISNADDAEAVAYFDLAPDGTLINANGQTIDEVRNLGTSVMEGEPGNFTSPNGHWHNFIKNCYLICTGKNWSNSDPHYFACQAISSDPNLYENSEIGAKGKAWPSI